MNPNFLASRDPARATVGEGEVCLSPLIGKVSGVTLWMGRGFAPRVDGVLLNDVFPQIIYIDGYRELFWMDFIVARVPGLSPTRSSTRRRSSA